MDDNPLAAWLRGEGEDDAAAQPPARPEQGPAPWLAESGADDGGRRRRLWWLLPLAAIPWLAMVTIALAGGVGGHPSETRDAAATVTGGVPQAAPGDVYGEDALRAAAAVAVRTSVTDGRRRYVDTVAPESLRWVGSVAVVTVRAVVLRGRDGRWLAARPARFAVPLRGGADGPRVLATPWPLPPPSPGVAAGDFRRVDDEELATAAAAALGRAGYDGLDGLRLGRDPALAAVLQATVRARAPGEPTPRRHELWLADEPVPRLLGHDAPPSPPPSAAPVPELEPS